MIEHQYFFIYKPYGMLSQFSREGAKPTLADLKFTFPKDVYPVGRLDADSEGLLILTNDKGLNHQLLDPKYKHQRTYLVQVEGSITPKAIEELAKGVSININKKMHHTAPAKVERVSEPEWIPERDPPVRFRKNIPTSWITITLTEGKNRQVRKMTAAVGFPTLRLIRIRIEQLDIKDLRPGGVMETDGKNLYKSLNIS